jgi:hypothetical protein
VITKQEAFTAHLATGTSWEFSPNLLLDHMDRKSNKSLRQVIMDIPSSKFPGKPVFHTLDPAWGSDNGVTFTFIQENEAEVRMYISGMVPYIREMYGEELLKAFSADSVERHSDSIFDLVTKQISSTTDVWIKNSLALDDEFYYTTSLMRLRYRWLTLPHELFPIQLLRYIMIKTLYPLSVQGRP